MSNTRNMNQGNNFWDFVASLQNNQGASPFAEGRGSAAEFNPFEGQEFWGPWAHHGRRHGPPHGPHGPHGHGRGGHRGPPPPEHEGRAHPPPPHVDDPSSRSPSPHHTPPESHHSRPQSPEPPHHPRPRSPHGPHHHRGRGRGPRGGHHNNHRHGPPDFPLDLSAIAEAFGSAFFGGSNAEASANTRGEQSKPTNEQQVKPNTQDGSFTPSIDLFSTPTSYILHTSLPGAKKPDLDITYNSTRNSITISG
ncbi:hypothetical protein E4T45_12547, partial [Aureobasidium sp. EXF-8846]